MMTNSNDLVRKMYKVSFVSGLIVEVALNRRELRELIQKKKVSGYKIIASGIE